MFDGMTFEEADEMADWMFATYGEALEAAADTVQEVE